MADLKADANKRRNQRARALKKLHAVIDSVLLPAGYIGDKDHWTRNNIFARTSIAIQKSKYGNGCFINVSAANRYPLRAIAYPLGPSVGVHRIADFVDAQKRLKAFDLHDYNELENNSVLLDTITSVLRDRALPWLNYCHTLRGAYNLPKPMDYLK
ncbi:DUF4304 domain-containing protein [Ahrensia kielensis]|uniref:DUF4304 domain-containing protein n=1 Tax=Ahrensia kielensis TaxID=76980 RepID=A0ABU9T7W6_9HYPH